MPCPTCRGDNVLGPKVVRQPSPVIAPQPARPDTAQAPAPAPARAPTPRPIIVNPVKDRIMKLRYVPK